MDNLICAICGFKAKTMGGRATHIRCAHKISLKEYYLTYHSKNCLFCGKQIPYKCNQNYDKNIFCSHKCFTNSLICKKRKFRQRAYRIASELLLEDLRRLHKKYGGYITQKLINNSGEYASKTYYDRFGSHEEICKLAGVPFFPSKIYEPQKRPLNNLLTIQIDSREKFPYSFSDSIVKKMNVGDYKIADIDTEVIIERKGFGDIKTSLSFGGGYTNFCKELDRAREQKLYVVVLVDASMKSFMTYRNQGKMSNKALFHNLKVIESKYGDVCQFLFTGSRTKSANLVYLFCLMPKDYLRSLDLQKIYDAGEIYDYIK